MNIEWLDGNRIKVEPPKKPLKLTGTRLATVLGLNAWATPFSAWCEVTRTYKAPFEDTKYTLAGKAIEPKQAQYMRDSYFMPIITPTEVFGEDYFRRTYGDFFKDIKVFGGMWDYLNGKTTSDIKAVLEMKTTKRVEDWAEDIPEYYALQAALYAFLLGVDNVIMVASFLEGKDYDHPEEFICSNKNTITRPFRVSERYPHFKETHIRPALDWWKEHVLTGISPVFDEKADAEILKVLRNNSLSPDSDIDAFIREAEALKAKLDAHASEVAEDEKRYKALTELIKKAAMKQFREGNKTVSMTGNRFVWSVSKSTTESVNKDALKADGLLDKYVTTKDSYRLTMKERDV